MISEINTNNDNKEDKQCRICFKSKGNYSCPKCKIMYCSLTCYRNEKHLQCSEKFYQQQVEEGFQGLTIDEEEKEKMIKLLRRFEEQSMDKEIDMKDLENYFLNGGEEEEIFDKFEGKNLDELTYDEIWNELSEKERDEFQQLIKNKENIGDIIEFDLPWWESKEAEIRFKKRNNLIDIQPVKLPSNLNHSIIMIKVINLAYTYFITYRLFGGDLKQNQIENILLPLLPTILKKDHQFNLMELHHYLLTNPECINLLENRETVYLGWKDVSLVFSRCFHKLKKKKLVSIVEVDLEIKNQEDNEFYVLLKELYKVSQMKCHSNQQEMRQLQMSIKFLYTYLISCFIQPNHEIMQIWSNYLLQIQHLLLENQFTQ
ncbi:hypothetical protein K502DRAFT_234797 [Neoconidiobolus thromboides FSU 785]|nr:hypothetical protein K502DRAFT_234797 [Neoconidiobolus thromboides FSU 785]